LTAAHLATIFGLIGMFICATALPINMGALGLAAAFIVGSLFVDMTPVQILSGFPGDLFVTLVGITYLFAIAESNGTVDLLVHYGVKATGKRTAVIPWVMFFVGALLTSIGAVSPGAVAILAPVAMRFAYQHRINPMLMGLMVVHGCQGGGFSPISIYGGITNQVMERAGLETKGATLFLASLAFNLAIAVVISFIFRSKPGTNSAHATSEMATQADAAKLTPQRALTLAALLALAVGALAFNLNVGFVAITAAVALAIAFPAAQKGAVDKAAWSTVLLICGVITYISVLQKAGTIEWIGNGAAHMGSPLLAVLLLCYVAGIVSAFASSVGVLGATIPLAVPLLALGDLNAVGVIAAIAVAATIVDASPFSTNGALVLVNIKPNQREAMFKQLLFYGGVITLFGPLFAWLFLVLPS
jgi:Na+/H+ antiporter NhaD/arsenite permease-like protein